MKKYRLLHPLLSRTAIFATVGAIAVLAIATVVAARIDSPIPKDDRKSEEVVNESSGTTNFPRQSLTAAEQDEMAAVLTKLANKSTAGLTEVKHPDGSASIDLKDRFQNVILGRVNSDGSISLECFDEPESAARFVGVDSSKVDAKRRANSINKQTMKLLEVK